MDSQAVAASPAAPWSSTARRVASRSRTLAGRPPSSGSSSAVACIRSSGRLPNDASSRYAASRSARATGGGSARRSAASSVARALASAAGRPPGLVERPRQGDGPAQELGHAARDPEAQRVAGLERGDRPQVEALARAAEAQAAGGEPEPELLADLLAARLARDRTRAGGRPGRPTAARRSAAPRRARSRRGRGGPATRRSSSRRSSGATRSVATVSRSLIGRSPEQHEPARGPVSPGAPGSGTRLPPDSGRARYAATRGRASGTSAGAWTRSCPPRRPSSATARRRNAPIAATSDSTPRAAIASWARSRLEHATTGAPARRAGRRGTR